MSLTALLTHEGSALAADEGLALARELFPMCRSITGNGVRRTLDVVGNVVPLVRTEVASGTAAFDWEVPWEWNISDAWIADSEGRRLVDFRQNSLHVVSYSMPVNRVMSRDELEPHLYSLPEHPDWIPYRTSYYRETWGFCLRHHERLALGSGPFHVVIQSTLEPGSLTYAECVVPGTSKDEALVYTHVCHPSLANDNLTGIVACALLGRAMAQGKPRLTWRFVFAPGTIGSLTWLSRNPDCLTKVKAGLVVGLLGDGAPLTFKRSRKGSSAIDRIAEYVLAADCESARIVDFEPYGYDERQFCSPGIDLPVGRLTRSPNGTYPEYHTSADNLAFISGTQLAESIRVLARILSVIDRNRRPLNLSPRGEPRLGTRGLYRTTGGTSPSSSESALLWVLSYADGDSDLVDIARRSGLPFDLLDQAAAALEDVMLVREATPGERLSR